MRTPHSSFEVWVARVVGALMLAACAAAAKAPAPKADGAPPPVDVPPVTRTFSGSR